MKDSAPKAKKLAENQNFINKVRFLNELGISTTSIEMRLDVTKGKIGQILIGRSSTNKLLTMRLNSAYVEQFKLYDEETGAIKPDIFERQVLDNKTLQKEIERLNNEFNDFKNQINERLTILEAKINGSLKN